MSYADKTLTCRDCGTQFVFTAGEQEFYAQKGFTNEPTRCTSCRQARKQGGGGRSSGTATVAAAAAMAAAIATAAAAVAGAVAAAVAVARAAALVAGSARCTP